MEFVDAGTHVVVGTDGSDTAVGAVRWAAAVAEAIGKPLRVVHSVPKRTPTREEGDALSRELADSLSAAGAHVLAEAVADVRNRHPNARLTTRLDDGPAADAVLASATDAAILVVGATGRGSIERWLLGSTALRVVTRAKCPAVVWRGDPADPGPDARPVVVGVDVGATSAAAVEVAFALAAFLRVQVRAVRAWTDEFAIGSATPSMLRMSGPTALLVDWEAVARAEAATLSRFLAPLRDRFPDVAVDERSIRGSASRELLQAMEDAQLAVVGSHGRGRLAGALLGSTSQNLLHRADRPIVVSRDTPDRSDRDANR